MSSYTRTSFGIADTLIVLEKVKEYVPFEVFHWDDEPSEEERPLREDGLKALTTNGLEINMNSYSTGIRSEYLDFSIFEDTEAEETPILLEGSLLILSAKQAALTLAAIIIAIKDDE